LKDSPPAERESAEWIFPIYDYRHPPIKKALWLLKYKGKKRLARVFAEAMYGRILEELSELSVMENFKNPILIPIPLANKRYRERGYNQAELICKELIQLSKTNPLSPPIDKLRAPLSMNTWRGVGGEVFTLGNNILIKPRETEHQARIENRAERLRNIVGSFAVKNQTSVKHRNVILIDDITTTGATLNEARKILKQNGARKIIAFTVAH
jgi:predicted amidophosphoribosyltransferase